MIKVIGGVVLLVLVVVFFRSGGTVEQLLDQIGQLLQPLVDLGEALARRTGGEGS